MKTDMLRTQYSNSPHKQDVIRNVVVKYIDYFYPSDAASTNAVAIDNKIEQAMDLVKSHLMFAVREEVEVLKERIAELMDRINQLETENSILKAHASQEVLAQLQIPPVTPSYMQPNVMPVVVSAGAAVAAVAAVAVSAAQVVSVPSPGQAPPTN